MIRSFLYRIYPFASLPSSGTHIDNFVWIASLLVEGIYVTVFGCIVWAPACFWLLGRDRVERVSGHLKHRLVWCILAGVATIAVVYGLDSVLSLLAMPGQVVGAVISALFLLMLIVGYTAAALWVIRLARTQSASPVAVAVGAGIMMILQFLPFVGTPFVICFVVLALGSVGVAVFAGNRSTLQTAASNEPQSSQQPTVS